MKSPQNIILVVLTILIVVILLITAISGDMTPKENLFLTILLTFLAIAASWLASHIYSQKSFDQLRTTLKEEHRENLRTYALNATEKVQNLSSEMERLIEYLSQTLDIKPQDESFQVILERVRASRLALRMLKSMNDTAVSDWRGVIGEDLARQADVESSLDEVYDRLESLVSQVSQHDEHLTDLPFRLEQVRAGIETQAKRLASTSPIRVRSSKKNKERMGIACPHCGQINETKVVFLPGWSKGQQCLSCSEFFSIAVDTNLDFEVSSLESHKENYSCPLCNNKIEINYPPNATQFTSQFECNSCKATYSTHVDKGMININPTQASKKETLDKLRPYFDSFDDNQSIRDIARLVGVPQSAVKIGFEIIKNLDSGISSDDASSDIQDEKQEDTPTS